MLARTKIDWELSDNIEQDLWEKMVFLSALAATCLFRANVAEIIAAPGGRDVIERALATNIEIASREGHGPRDAAILRAQPPHRSRVHSQLVDAARLEAGRPTESDHIIGWMLDKARKHGLDDSVLSLAYTQLETYDSRRSFERLPG